MKFKIDLGEEKSITLEPGRTCIKASPEQCRINELDEEEVQTIATIFADHGYPVQQIPSEGKTIEAPSKPKAF